MAKKSFNVKSTLAVPPKQFSVDDIESAVKQIHDAKAISATKQAEPPKEPVKMPENAPKPRPAVSQKSPPLATRRYKDMEQGPVKKVRLSVDIHPATHKKLKIKAIEQDSDIMHYVEMLIERDLGLA